jgi:biotin synthase-related radical SAM superfamily protein
MNFGNFREVGCRHCERPGPDPGRAAIQLRRWIASLRSQ